MSLYSKKDLDAISKNNGFIRDNLEKVYRLIEVLEYINLNPLLSDALVLKGGTAINLIVFDMPRLSVDIDLDFNIETSKEEMLLYREKINDDIKGYMRLQGYVLNSNSKNPHSLDSWVFNYQNSVGNRDNIKIEINYSMRNHIYPPVVSNSNISFLPSFNVKTLSFLELFGGKIKALIERTAPRDLYDVNNMIVNNVFCEDDLDSLRKVIIFYLTIGGSDKCKTHYNFNSIDNLGYKQIRDNLIPMLRKSEHFDFERTKANVKDFLIKLMNFDDREIRYIEEFNNKRYNPELLFNDSKILDRIRSHPMAIWKTRE